MNAPAAPATLANVEAHISAGRYPEAERACDAILASNPRDGPALFYRALIAFHLSGPEAARERLEPVLRDHPSILNARYLKADLDRIAGRFAEAAQGYGDTLAAEFSLPATGDMQARMESLIEMVTRSPVARWARRMETLKAFGFSVSKSVPPEALSTATLERSRFPTMSNDKFRDRLATVCNILGAMLEAPAAWLARVSEQVLVPWMRTALASGCYDNAIDIETTIYTIYVRSQETQEHFRHCFSLWTDDMRRAGKQCAEANPAPPRQPGGPLPRIAFFVHNVTPLAHVSALLEVLQGHAELAEPLIEPYLFYLSGEAPTLERFRAAGVRLEPLVGPALASGHYAALLRMRRRVAETGIEALAWISLAVMMSFAFALRIAPRQVWWGMKYLALEFPEIDDYLTGGGESGIQQIHGRPWRVGPVVAAQWFAPELSGDAARVRASLGAAGIVYGTFGREEKLSDPAFLDAIAEILRARPEAVFLWTGRVQDRAIQQRFEAAGVASRCHFIGWVNTKLYAQVIDVFLDSFPFPCGFTIYEAMAAGKAMVLYASQESEHGGIHAIVGSMLAAGSSHPEDARLARSIFNPDAATNLYMRASSPRDYVGMAVRLAADPDLRRRAGEANRQFTTQLMTDRRRAARTYVDHLLGRSDEHR